MNAIKKPGLQIGALLIAACALAGADYACGQPYPNRPIRLILPFSAGGATDAIARILAQKLAESIGQQVVVDNRSGGTTVIGTEMGAKALPDGYTLLMIAASHASNPSMHPNLPYDLMRDFSPVTLATSGPFLLAMHPAIRANDIAGLIALAKASPGVLTCGSSGTGSTVHLALELLNVMAGTQIMHVPYKGSAQGISGLIGGHISMYFGGVPALLGHVKSGRLKGLAVSTLVRSEAAPNIPTIAEAAIPGYDVSAWYGIVAPAGTPRQIILRLNTEIVRQLRAQDVRDKLAANGAEIVASTPEQFGAYLAAEIAKWQKVVKAANIKAD